MSYVKRDCAYCKKPYAMLEGDERRALKRSKTGKLYCSRSCSAAAMRDAKVVKKQ